MSSCIHAQSAILWELPVTSLILVLKSKRFQGQSSIGLCPGQPTLRYCVCVVKVKESRNRPGVAQRVPGGLGSRISWHSAREGGEVVSLTHRPPLPPLMFLVLIFTRGWVDPRAMVWSEGNMSLKSPVTPPGIDPWTVRLVAQHLNHYATPGLRVCVVAVQTYSDRL